MTEAIHLYIGQTLHARLTPFRHSFRYRIASIMVDVDRLASAAKASRLFSINRFNLFSFYEKDHGARSGGDLRPWAEQRFGDAGLGDACAQICLFTFPRILGYVFNPISVWFGYDRSGKLRGVIYEVNNTFGDSHAYVVPVCDDGDALHTANKQLYVSPFFDRAGAYRFRLRPPGEDFKLVIRYDRPDGTALVATQTGHRAAVTTPKLLSTFFSMPLMTLKVITAIHWEAARLFLKGAKYQSRPKAAEAASAGRALSTNTKMKEVNG
jgi:hypothetical protein